MPVARTEALLGQPCALFDLERLNCEQDGATIRSQLRALANSLVVSLFDKFGSIVVDSTHEIPPVAATSPKSATPPFFLSSQGVCSKRSTPARAIVQEAAPRIDHDLAGKTVFHGRLLPTVSLCGHCLHGTTVRVEAPMPASLAHFIHHGWAGRLLPLCRPHRQICAIFRRGYLHGLETCPPPARRATLHPPLAWRVAWSLNSLCDQGCDVVL
ncbi:hypothetical protein MRX96_035346 [Rhipicephalus microplus]